MTRKRHGLPACRAPALVMLSAAALTACAVGAPPAPGVARAGGANLAACPVPGHAAAKRATLRHLINAARRDRGLPALAPDRRLRHAAQAHACDDAAHRTISHTGSDGATLPTRLRRVGYDFSYAEENTGGQFDTPERGMAIWMASAPHRANILSPQVSQIGIGLARGPGGDSYWVIDFGAPR